MWKENVLDECSEYHFIGSILSRGLIEGDENLTKYEKEGGSVFRERARVAGTHTFFDTKAIYKHLQEILTDFSGQTIMDLGCGDGRVVQWVLENTQANVIAVDGTFESLKRLEATYLQGHKEFEDRVLLLHADVLNMPIRENVCDFIWTYEVLCFLGDEYEKGVQKCIQISAPGGLIAIGDRSKEFGVVHELMNRGPEGMLKTFKTDIVIDSWNESEIHTRVLTAEEIVQIMEKNGLDILKRTGVSFLPLIISYLRSNGVFKDEIEHQAEQLAEVTMHYSNATSLNRTNIIVGKK